MKVIVVGLGSMGKRRIRLIQNLNPRIEIIGVDSNPERVEAVQKETGIECVASISEAFKERKINAAFVCTSPLSHGAIVYELLEYGVDIFTEINLISDWYKKALDMAKRKNVKMFLSSTFLYRNDIQYIIKKVKNKTVNYMYHTGQYLPDWHPWENYKNFFVSDVRTNGCREILAIELPWIIECFGEIASIHVVKSKMTQLDLNYSDNYLLIIEHETGNKGCIAVDVVARKAMRSLEVFGENLQIFWDGTPNSLKQYEIEEHEMVPIQTYSNIDKDKRYSDNIIENAYADEIAAFFAWIQKNDDRFVRHNFEQDLETLKWIDYIEK